MMARRRIAMEIEAASFLQHPMKFDQPRGHHGEVSHHCRVLQEAVEGFHHLDYGNVRTLIDELMISLRRVGPAPRIGEGVELCLAYFAAGLAEENVVICVGIKRRIQIDEIDAFVREFVAIPQPRQIISEI
jgi:hypothetical protein